MHCAREHGRRLAWLAMLALGLLTLLPTVSRLLAAPMQLPPPALLGWCDAHVLTQAAVDAHKHEVVRAGDDTDVLAACDYCSVFCCSPWLCYAVAALLLFALPCPRLALSFPLPTPRPPALLQPPSRGPPVLFKPSVSFHA